MGIDILYSADALVAKGYTEINVLDIIIRKTIFGIAGTVTRQLVEITVQREKAGILAGCEIERQA